MAVIEDFAEQTPFRYTFTAPARQTRHFPAQLAELQGLHPHLPLALRREFYQRDETTGDHCHLDFVALYTVLRGSGLHVINGHSCALTRGDVYLLAPGSIHSYVRYQNLEIDALYFSPTLLREEEIAALRALPGFWPLFADSTPPSAEEPRSEPRLHLRPEAWREVQTHFFSLNSLWNEGDAASMLLLRQRVFALLVHLARCLKQQPTLTKSRHISQHAPTIQDTLSWCEENLAQPITVPQLAARLFLSPGHFSQLFTREVGVAPAAFIRRLRLEKARTLLRETHWPLSRIAEQTGFADAAHLARSFRALYQLTPQRFRQQPHSG